MEFHDCHMGKAFVVGEKLLQTTYNRRKGLKDRRSDTRNQISPVNGPDRRKAK